MPWVEAGMAACRSADQQLSWLLVATDLSELLKSEVSFISSSQHRFRKAPWPRHCGRPIHDCTHLVWLLLIFHLRLFLHFPQPKDPTADKANAICKFLSDILSITSSYITKLSVVNESGVKMVSKRCFDYGFIWSHFLLCRRRMYVLVAVCRPAWMGSSTLQPELQRGVT